MDEQELGKCFATVVNIAREAGKMVVEAFSQEKRVELKSSVADLVTETDKNVEVMIISNLRNKYPTHSFIGEESTVTGVKCNLTDNPTWIIDPIDGTTNFVHGYPQVAISIALLVNQKTEIGLVYNPIRNEMYTARPGQGAYCNDRKLKVTNTEDLGQALICTEIGSSRDPKILDSKFKTMRNIVQKAHGYLTSGSAAMNMAIVASGTADCFGFEGIHCWDIAAGILLVLEAGGVVLDTSGRTLVSEQITAVFTTPIAEMRLAPLCFAFYNNLTGEQDSLRYQGSAAINMATVARGQLDAYFEAGVHCWDFAAGVLLVIEAGGVVMDMSGGPVDLMSRRVLCAGTNKLAQQIAQLIEPIDYERD